MTTLKHKYNCQKGKAKARNIEWQLTYEEWLEIWEKSGHLHERGKYRYNYQMCRFKDEGPYSKTNVYIARQDVNKKDAWNNGKTPLPKRKDKLTIEQRREIFLRCVDLKYGDLVKIAKEYGINSSYVCNIKSGRVKL